MQAQSQRIALKKIKIAREKTLPTPQALVHGKEGPDPWQRWRRQGKGLIKDGKPC
jgi:hypothetical protein